jgi:hypothetical protein
MIVSIGVDCPYCGKCNHACDPDTGEIYLNPDIEPDEPCEHFVFGKYDLADDRGFFDCIVRTCSALSALPSEAQKSIEDEWLPEVYGGNFGKDLPVPLVTPHETTEEAVSFRAGQKVDATDIFDEIEVDDVLDEEDERDADDDVLKREGEGEVFGEGLTSKGAEALQHASNAHEPNAKRNEPAHPKDFWLKSCVLWSENPQELVHELHQIWQQIER